MGVRRRRTTNWIILGLLLVLTALSAIGGCGTAAPRMREAMTSAGEETNTVARIGDWGLSKRSDKSPTESPTENPEGNTMTTSAGEETLSVAHYANRGTMVIPEGSTFSIAGANYANGENAVLLVAGVCNIEGSVENYGNIVVSRKGVLNVLATGSLANHATIVVQNAGVLNISGTLDNGPLENALGVTFVNQRGGEIRTLLTPTGPGTLNNHKTIQNYGLIQNDGAVHCIGAGHVDYMQGRGKVQGLPVQEPPRRSGE